MKTKYVALLFVTSLLLVSNKVIGQRIRKDHLEMTPAEKTAYVNALITLRDNGTLSAMASHHSSHFNSPIHSTGSYTGEFFLPWHRIFAVEMENAIRSTSALASNLSVPYWDWRLENTSSNVTWDDAGFLQLSTINSPTYNVTRSFSSVTLASQAAITSLLAIPSLISNPPAAGLKSSSVNYFTYRLEYWHDRGHNFIGGTMGSSSSPRDPIFFLHHNFVDKLWQDWYNSDNGIAKIDHNFGPTSSSYWMWMNITPNQVKDSRYMKYQEGSGPVSDEEIWYAYNKKLILDGMNGTAFNVTGSNKLYCYTAWNGSGIKGEIYAGDVKRDASDNVVADNRGGLKIKSGATCTFSAGAAVVMMPGFEAEYGSSFTATIVPTPCGFNSLKPSNDEMTGIEDIDVLDNNHNLSVYSEMGSNLIVNYSLNTNSNVTLVLYNMMGQQIYSREIGQQTAGTYQDPIYIDLASGVYVCKLIVNNTQESVKFVH